MKSPPGTSSWLSIRTVQPHDAFVVPRPLGGPAQQEPAGCGQPPMAVERESLLHCSFSWDKPMFAEHQLHAKQPMPHNSGRHLPRTGASAVPELCIEGALGSGPVPLARGLTDPTNSHLTGVLSHITLVTTRAQRAMLTCPRHTERDQVAEPGFKPWPSDSRDQECHPMACCHLLSVTPRAASAVPLGSITWAW